jgi:hypothetical protein
MLEKQMSHEEAADKIKKLEDYETALINRLKETHIK